MQRPKQPGQHGVASLVIVLVGIGVGLLITMGGVSTVWGAPQRQEEEGQELYLPNLIGGESDSPPDGTATPTASATASPTPTATGEPQATATASPTPTPTLKPTATLPPEAIAATAFSSCPEGFHLINEDGSFGVSNPDTFDEEGGGFDGYYCVPDDAVEDATCSAFGEPVLVGGEASCACDEGYVGATCTLCAAGYELNDDQTQCVLAPAATPAALIEGAGESVAYGETLTLRALAPESDGASGASTDAPLVDGTWEIVHGYGCLSTGPEDESCNQRVDAVETVRMDFPLATETIQTFNLTGIQFVPASGEPAIDFTVVTQPADSIPINGYGPPQLKPFLDNMTEFMKSRCVGAAVVGVAYFGKIVGVWGFGKQGGRSAPTIFAPACGTDADDPYYPLAAEMQYDSSMQIGSVSKAIAYATARWALKGALQEWDKDVDLIALSDSRIVSGQRLPSGALRVNSWDVNAGGIVEQRGGATSTDIVRHFDLVKLTANRFVVALRNDGTFDNRLRLLVYDVDGGGAVTERAATRVDDLPGEVGDKIIQAEVTRVADNRIVVALRRTNSTYALLVFQVEVDGSLVRLDELETADRLRNVKITTMPIAGVQRIMVAQHTADGGTQMLVYDINAGGELTLRASRYDPQTVHTIDLDALNETRAVGAVRGDDGTQKVILYSFLDLSTGPIIAVLDTASTETAVEDVAIKAYGTNGFATVARTRNGTLELNSWETNQSVNEIVLRGSDTAGTNKGMALTNVLYGSDTLTAILFAAIRTAEDDLRIIPWDVTPPNPERLVNEADGANIDDHEWDDNDVEEMLLVGFDLPQGMLPEDLRSRYAGDERVIVPLGDRVITNKKGEVTGSCTSTGIMAPEEWQEMRLRDLFGHRTGMAKSAEVGYNTIVRDYLDDLRGLNLQSQWAAEEAALRAEFGDSAVEQGRTALGWDTGLVTNGETSGYLVPGPGLHERALLNLASCLPHETGTHWYSNASPQVLRLVMEHVTGREYVFPEGYPELHDESLLSEFLASEIGLATTATSGIFPRKVALAGPNDALDPGPLPRNWDGTEYYADVADLKRPHCEWDGATCDFNQWFTDPSSRLAWYWEQDLVQYMYHRELGLHATGAMRVQAEAFLTFLKYFWVGGYDVGGSGSFNPFIGQRRNGVFTRNSTVAHNGVNPGASMAWGIQRSDGVDIFVAIPQSDSPSAADADNPDGADFSTGALRELMMQAANSVDWAEAVPIDEIQLAP